MVMVTILLCFGSRVNLGVRSMVILGVVSCSSSALYGLCILSLLLLSLLCFVVGVVVLSIFSRTKMSKWGRVVTPQII